MRTLHFGLRVADPGRSTAFYERLGYEVVGRVPRSPIGALTMLKLPDDEFISIELVHDPAVKVQPASGLSHVVVSVDSMADTVRALAAKGVVVDAPSSPDGSDDFWTATVEDPDGYRIELVQWPAGHPAGMTADDFAGPEGG